MKKKKSEPGLGSGVALIHVQPWLCHSGGVALAVHSSLSCSFLIRQLYCWKITNSTYASCTLGPQNQFVVAIVTIFIVTLTDPQCPCV